MINSAEMNIGVHVSLSDLVSLVCMPRSGIAGSYGSSKGNPPTLLVGMQTSTATMENSVEISYT